MIINADSLLPHLKEKVRPTQSDGSRHLLCPQCGIRTKLNTLADGRRKCTICGKKFRIHKVTEETKLQQCAEILLCFCLDFSSNRTAQITHHRYRLVAEYYDHFRRLLAEKSVPQEKARHPDPDPSTPLRADIHVLHEKSRCIWCNSKIRLVKSGEKTPAFGIQLKSSGEVAINRIPDDESEPHERRAGYAGLLCCGKLHRFTEAEKTKDGAGQLWTWILEHERNHHGIGKKNPGEYVKEMEWKYNNRSVDPDMQARKIIEFMPASFLTSWSDKEKILGVSASSPITQ